MALKTDQENLMELARLVLKESKSFGFDGMNVNCVALANQIVRNNSFCCPKILDSYEADFLNESPPRREVVTEIQDEVTADLLCYANPDFARMIAQSLHGKLLNGAPPPALCLGDVKATSRAYYMEPFTPLPHGVICADSSKLAARGERLMLYWIPNGPDAFSADLRIAPRHVLHSGWVIGMMPDKLTVE